MADSSRQLRLLPAPQPLVDRLGAEFFRQAPREPGVYWFYGDAEELLYVGKARDLRARLSSYRRTHGQSRKTIRLIHAARRVEWELCPDETAALLRENELLRTLRPRFNRAGTWPRSARFLVLASLPASLELRLAAEPESGPDLESFGAFRGAPSAALASLARLLWLATPPRRRPLDLPHALAAADSLRAWSLPGPDAAPWIDDLREFLRGTHDHLLALLVDALPDPPSAFERAFVAAQFERLTEFHRRGPVRIRRWREQSGLPPHRLLAPEELDDLAVAVPLPSPAPPFRPPDAPLPALHQPLFP